MTNCDLDGFYCKTHQCGVDAEGVLRLCAKEGCPHCRKGPVKISGRKYRRLVEEHDRAQAAVIRWEDKLGRALGRLQAARNEERRLRLRLEKAERDGVEPEPEEGE